MALVLAVSIGLIGCGGPGGGGPTPSDKIVIAASASKTGPLSPIHSLAKAPITGVYTGMHPKINVEGTEYPVELDIRDDASILANMLDNTEDIIDDIQEGKVHFLLGPTCTAYLERQAALCSPAKVVQMGMEGGATSLFDELMNYEYSFFNLSFSNWFQIPVLAKMLAEAHEAYNATDPCEAVIGYQNDDHGLEYNDQATKYFAKEGIDIKKAEPITSATVLENLVQYAKDNNIDILCIFGYTDWTWTVHAVCMAKEYNPKALVCGPGVNFGLYYSGLAPAEIPPIAGNASNGVITFAVANNKTTGWAGDVIRTMEAAVSMGATDYWGHPLYWKAMDFIYAGAAAVGSNNGGEGFTIDQTEFRDYIANLGPDDVDIWYVTPEPLGDNYSWTDEQLVNPVPDDYAGLLNYKCHTGEIGQWQAQEDGSMYLEIVGYDGIGETGDEYELVNYQVTAPFVYPKPAWPE